MKPKNILKIEKLNLSNYDLNFNITGTIAFFDGKVEMKECSFNNIDSEDSINIVNSKLLLKNIGFDNSKSDAVDIDYSEGLIENLKFTNIGNDALDFQGLIF